MLLAGIGAYAATARKLDRPAAWMMAPYAAWSGFATLLNEEIVRLNR
ncbi:MAG: tryptophan-rich sensory protein [Polyangia bacterium]